jgi:ribosome modulation factor
MQDDKNINSDQRLNFAEGYAACVEAAFHEGYALEECPYAEGSLENKCWIEGWKKAQEILT